MVPTTLVLLALAGSVPDNRAATLQPDVGATPGLFQLAFRFGRDESRPLVLAAADECVPPCRTGFVCARGRCVSPCNPPCGPSERCTSQGECVPADTQVRQSPIAPGSLTRDEIYKEIEHQKDMMPGRAGPLLMLWAGIPTFGLNFIATVVAVVFIVLTEGDTPGPIIGASVCGFVALVAAGLITLGAIQLAARKPKRAAIQSRIDELNEMLRAAPAVPGAARSLPLRGTVVARF